MLLKIASLQKKTFPEINKSNWNLIARFNYFMAICYLLRIIGCLQTNGLGEKSAFFVGWGRSFEIRWSSRWPWHWRLSTLIWKWIIWLVSYMKFSTSELPISYCKILPVNQKKLYLFKFFSVVTIKEFL